MEKWIGNLLVLLVILYVKLHYSDGLPDDSLGYERLIIDCGDDLGLLIDSTRRPDQEFIKTGENKIFNIFKDPNEMTTIRIFPDGVKNCYDLPLQIQNKYLIRAGFYYGNYDGLLLPPTFDLQIDGKLWATVSTSLSEEPLYYEAIYPIKRKMVSVCLVRTRKGGVPFISSLEATKLPDDFYRLMDNNTAFNLQNRTNFGGSQVGAPFTEAGDDEEAYSRIWKPVEMPNYRKVSSYNNNPLTAENQPPGPVMEDAIEPIIASDSISVLIDFPARTQLSAYFVFYFMDTDDGWGNDEGNRKMQIYIDGHEKMITEGPQNKTCLVVSLFPVTVSGPAKVTISPVENSTLPPILNAMEVFTTNDQSKVERSYYYSSLLLISLHVIGVVLAF